MICGIFQDILISALRRGLINADGLIDLTGRMKGKFEILTISWIGYRYSSLSLGSLFCGQEVLVLDTT